MWTVQYTGIIELNEAKFLSPVRLQALVRTNAGLLSSEPVGTNFNEILN